MKGARHPFLGFLTLSPPGSRHDDVLLKRPSGHRLQEGCVLFLQRLGALTLGQAHKNVVAEDAAEHVSVDKGRNAAKHRPYFYSGSSGRIDSKKALVASSARGIFVFITPVSLSSNEV